MNSKEITIAYLDLVESIGKKYDVPPFVIFSIIEKESSGIAGAIGPTCDYGLMQMTQPALTDYNNRHHAHFVLKDLFRPEVAIETGTWYLSWLFRQLGNWYDVCRAYNVGIGRIKKDPKAGRIYADRVQEIMNNYTFEV